MIPKIIYQTYKDPYDELPQYIKDSVNTWKNQNPGYEYQYFDDAQAAEFVLENYGKEYYDLFINLPIGVMRGDMFRYLVIYKNGGVYADLDTECWEPIDTWLIPDKHLIVCPESEQHLCQWTFAGQAGSIALKGVIDLMIERLHNPDYDMVHMVHYHTGPAVFTYGIFKGLGIDYTEDGSLIDSAYYDKYPQFNENSVHIYVDNRWRIFHFESVKHLYGSQNWNDGYVQWIRQVNYYE